MTNPWTPLPPPGDTTNRTAKMLLGSAKGVTNGEPVPPGGAGSATAGVVVTWESNAPHTTHLRDLDAPPFLSGGYATGRFVIRITPPVGWKGFEYWVEDPTTNVGEPDGYQYAVAPNMNDVTVTPEFYDASASGWQGPAVIYVSSLSHQKRLLRLRGYTAVSGGAPVGTPTATQTATLAPPADLEMIVTMEAPDGRVSSRWRKVAFAMRPLPEIQAGSQVIYSGSYILTPTRIKTDSFIWLNGTGRYKPAPGREVWLYRPFTQGARSAGTLVRPYPRIQWPGQGQWRRILEVGGIDDYDYGFIEYERPFDPPLTTNDTVAIVDNCVMVNVQESPIVYPDMSAARFLPTLSPIYIDTWMAYHNINNTAEFVRALRVQAYAHAANYPADGDYEYDEERMYQASVGAWLPRGPIREVSIPFNYPPRVYAARIMESHINTGKMRVELQETLGDVNTWRVYARTGGAVGDSEWPTIDGTVNSVPSDEYLVATTPGLQRFAETSLDLSATNVRAMIVCHTFDGEPGPITQVFRAAAPETLPMISNVKIIAEDTPTQSNNRITYQSRNIDPASGFRVEVHREEHRGQSRGENPTVVLIANTAIFANTGDILHAGNTPGATIDSKRNFSSFTPLPYRVVTFHYDFWNVIAGGNEVYLGRHSRTDAFIVPFQGDVSFGTLHARKIYDCELDAGGRVITPVTISIGMLGARNLHYTGESTGFAPIVQYEFSINGGTTWHRVDDQSQRIAMQADRNSHLAFHQIWGHRVVESGGTVYTIIYRAFYQQQTDFILNVRRALVTSDPLSIRLAPVAAPGPF